MLSEISGQRRLGLPSVSLRRPRPACPFAFGYASGRDAHVRSGAATRGPPSSKTTRPWLVPAVDAAHARGGLCARRAERARQRTPRSSRAAAPRAAAAGRAARRRSASTRPSTSTARRRDADARERDHVDVVVVVVARRRGQVLPGVGHLARPAVDARRGARGGRDGGPRDGHAAAREPGVRVRAVGRVASGRRRGACDDASLVWSGAATTCGAGLPRLDRQPFVQVSGGAAPSFEMAAFATELYYGDGDNSSSKLNFGGLVAIDALGRRVALPPVLARELGLPAERRHRAPGRRRLAERPARLRGRRRPPVDGQLADAADLAARQARAPLRVGVHGPPAQLQRGLARVPRRPHRPRVQGAHDAAQGQEDPEDARDREEEAAQRARPRSTGTTTSSAPRSCAGTASTTRSSRCTTCSTSRAPTRTCSRWRGTR